jgi:adenylosuccinate synthase
MNKVVIGLGFGDEGKGITTDYLCSLYPNSIVVRFSGGQQAGHTVIVNEKRHVFSNFGSGTLREIPTYWSKYCTMDPVGIIKELLILNSKLIHPILYIDKNAPVTTPYDKWANKNDEANVSNGTCGVGIYQTFKREQDHYNLVFEDLFDPKILDIKFNLIKEYYKSKEYFNENFLKFLNNATQEFKKCCDMLTHTSFIKLYNENIFYSGNNFIFEGSQGLLLDQKIGFFPYVTPSNIGTKNIEKFHKLSLTNDIYLITRAYQTRHGNGPMTNLNLMHNVILDKEETNTKNPYQGEFMISVLDLDLLIYGVKKDEGISQNVNNNLVITCLDNVKGKFTFTYKSKIFEYEKKEDFLKNIYNIFREHIEIKKVYYSESPYSKNIKELNI